jgi:hypothetical protein
LPLLEDAKNSKPAAIARKHPTGHERILKKPVATGDLAEMVRKVLDNSLDIQSGIV